MCSPYFAKVDRKKKLYWLQLDFLMLDYNVISFEYYDIYKKILHLTAVKSQNYAYYC